MAVTRDFLLEDTPMTMQIALQAKDGFVLVSDLKNRINNKVSSLTYSTKIYHDEVHGVEERRAIVVPARLVQVIEVRLQPDGWHVTAKQVSAQATADGSQPAPTGACVG